MIIPKSWIVKLEDEREKVGKVRDSLREALDEMEALKESCDEAFDNIDRAIDTLSQLA